MKRGSASASWWRWGSRWFCRGSPPLRDWGQSGRGLDMTWVMVGTVLVLLMQAGFLLLEIGFLAPEERGRRRRQDPRQPGDPDARVVGGRPGHQRPGQLALRHRRILYHTGQVIGLGDEAFQVGNVDLGFMLFGLAFAAVSLAIVYRRWSGSSSAPT